MSNVLLSYLKNFFVPVFKCLMDIMQSALHVNSCCIIISVKNNTATADNSNATTTTSTIGTNVSTMFSLATASRFYSYDWS